jgi:hypothetical protein
MAEQPQTAGQVIADALQRIIDPERAPELIERLRSLPMHDAWALNALMQGATCWMDADQRHVWFAHACKETGWVEAKLVFGRPIGTKTNGGGWCAIQAEPLSVAPSVTCDECGFHKVYVEGSF